VLAARPHLSQAYYRLATCYLKKGQKDKGTEEYLRLIAKENERLSRLIDNFLAFSRLERNRPFWQFVEVDLSVVIAV
jgi:signal transduction histidine kinase